MKSITFSLILLFVFPNSNFAQNTPPLAIPDTAMVVAEDTVVIQVLLNDYDPDGDEIRILESFGSKHGKDWDDNDSLVFYHSDYFTGQDSFFYYITDYGNPPLVSGYTPVYITVEENPNLPVAQNDSAVSMAPFKVNINILKNDSDPNDDDIEILSIVSPPKHGIAYIISDSAIEYKPVAYFTGTDTLQYNAVEKNTFKHYYSNNATVFIHIKNNPDFPVVKNDYGATLTFSSVDINVLLNDFDPQTEPVEIWEVQALTGSLYKDDISFSDSIVTCQINHPSSGNHYFKYRIREVNDTAIYSTWATITIDVSPNPEFPYIVNDVTSTVAGFPTEVNVVENDYNPTNDTLIAHLVGQTKLGIAELVSDSVVRYCPYFASSGIDTISYYLINKNGIPFPLYFGFLLVEIDSNHSYEELSINNIKAGVNSFGYLFNNFAYIPGYSTGYYTPAFEAPAGSRIHSLFGSTLWIGGINENSDGDSMHFAGERYRQIGVDYWSGPVSNVYNDEYDLKWLQAWILNKSQIVYHKQHYLDPGYTPIENISSWPGNGDTQMGQADQLAPYFDQNNNGLYEPFLGDYPLIRGDQAIFFIYNDDRKSHTESGGKKLGIEIHGMAYAFEEPSDSALWNTVFVHYDIYNRSDTTYFDTYTGIFSDFDIGSPWDDYVACSVQKGTIIGYNGTDYDDDSGGGPERFVFGYHDKLPAMGMTILGGPLMDNDGIDNPLGGCDEGMNGLNFGNGTADDERYGLTRFSYFNNGVVHVNTDPDTASEYYNLLKGIWRDSTQILYGGNGHTQGNAVGPACKFVFPGDSDSCNWGTGGILPNGGYNQNGNFWTEKESMNQPGDRRGIGISGPFTFKPGDRQELDFAFIFARDYEGNDPILILLERVDAIREMVIEDSIIYLPTILGVNEKSIDLSNILVFPNPVNSTLNFKLPVNDNNVSYSIKNISGITVFSGKLEKGYTHSIGIESLERGVYLLYLVVNERIAMGKFIKT